MVVYDRSDEGVRIDVAEYSIGGHFELGGGGSYYSRLYALDNVYVWRKENKRCREGWERLALRSIGAEVTPVTQHRKKIEKCGDFHYGVDTILDRTIPSVFAHSIQITPDERNILRRADRVYVHRRETKILNMEWIDIILKEIGYTVNG